MGLKAFLALGLGVLSLSDAALAGRADRQSRAISSTSLRTTSGMATSRI